MAKSNPPNPPSRPQPAPTQNSNDMALTKHMLEQMQQDITILKRNMQIEMEHLAFHKAKMLDLII